MDVLNTLCLHMGYIVKCVFTRVENDEKKFLDEMYRMIEYDIGINFDSNQFFMMDYKKIDQNVIGFHINDPFIPVDLLVMIRNLIRHSRMKQNIKNKSYLIHFREFKDEIHLEDKENTLRVEAFMNMHQFMTNPLSIRVYLIKKLVELKNKLKQARDNEAKIQCKIQMYRVETILKSIEKNTILEY